MLMKLLVLESSSPRLGEAIAALREAPISLVTTGDVGEAVQILQESYVEAVLAHPKSPVASLVAAMKGGEAPVLPILLLIESTAPKEAMPLLCETFVSALPLEYVHTPCFVELVRKALQHRDAQQYIEHLEVLHRFSVEMGTLKDLDAIVQVAIEQATEMTDADSAALFQYDDEEDVLIQMESAGTVDAFRGYQIRPGEGATGRAWSQQQPVVVGNYAEWEGCLDYPIAQSISVLAAVPVTWHDQRLGVMTVFKLRPGENYPPYQIHLLHLLSRQVAGSIHNAELYQRLRRDRDRMVALASIDRQILAISNTPERALRLVLRYALQLLDLSKGIISLTSVAGESAPLVYSQGFKYPERAERMLLNSWSRKQDVYRKEGVRLILLKTARDSHPPEVQSWLEDEGVHSGLTCALWIREEPVGTLMLFDEHSRRWTEEDLHVIKMLAGQASIALEKSLLTEKVKIQLAEVETLNRIMRATNRTLAPQEVLDLTCERIRQLLHVPTVIAGVVHNGTLIVTSEDSESGYPAAAGTRISLKDTPLLRQVIEEKKTLAFSDVQQEIPSLARKLTRTHTRGLLVVPLLGKEGALGFLAAESQTSHTFHPRQIKLVQAIAAAVTPALVNARLHQETEEAKTRAEQAYRQLHQLDEMKSQFVQNVSHELRTPLAIVKGYVDMALDDVFGFSMELELRHSMETIRTHTDNLVNIVESITALEEAELGKLQPTRQSLAPVVSAAVKAVWQRAMRRQVTIHTEFQPALAPLLIDAELLGRALIHVLDNAIKFNREGGRIWIDVRKEGGEVWISVRDEGIGMVEIALDRIFDRFYQLDGTTSRQYGGMGLGLSLVKEIVVQHGGRVWAESPGKERGTTVVIVLPQPGGDA